MSGELLMDEEKIGEALFDYYSKLFTTKGVEIDDLMLSSIDCMVVDEMNSSLLREIEPQEVRNAVFDLG